MLLSRQWNLHWFSFQVFGLVPRLITCADSTLLKHDTSHHDDSCYWDTRRHRLELHVNISFQFNFENVFLKTVFFLTHRCSHRCFNVFWYVANLSNLKCIDRNVASVSDLLSISLFYPHASVMADFSQLQQVAKKASQIDPMRAVSPLSPPKFFFIYIFLLVLLFYCPRIKQDH